jgi:dTDP-glucose 4,6-dehydratase
MSKKIVYVTGCLGFIGSYFTRKALEKNWIVKGVDKISYTSNLKLLDEFSQYPNFSFLKEDICDLKYLHDCDYIVNFAAESHVENSIRSSDEFIKSNISGVKNLLDLIRFKPINCGERPTLIHISTDEVYGDIEEGSHTETDILKPSNPYSASKASADMLILAWARTYGLQYNIIRPTNNYGIGQYPEKLIPLSIKNLSRGKKIKLHNNGTPTRNWLHADDTAEAVMKIIENGNRNEIYNISGIIEKTNLETVKEIIIAFNGTEEGWESHLDFTFNRIGQDVRYSLDDSKLRLLGWKCQKDFNIELVNIVNYYKHNFIW